MLISSSNNLLVLNPKSKLVLYKPDFILSYFSNLSWSSVNKGFGNICNILADRFANDKNVEILDTRNDYEFKIGHYKNAINPKINTFKDLKNYIKNNKEKFQNKKVGIYCTGGIRCEKAGPLMEKYGIETYQLKGGILKYFETTSADSWKGECFVFDYRVSLNKQLSQGTSKLCYGCNMPLTPRERKSPKYEEGYSCSICFDNMTEKKRRSLKDKREHWKKVL